MSSVVGRALGTQGGWFYLFRVGWSLYRLTVSWYRYREQDLVISVKCLCLCCDWVVGDVIIVSIIAMCTISALVLLCCHIVSLCSHLGHGVVCVLFSCKARWPPFSSLVGGREVNLFPQGACALASRYIREEEKKMIIFILIKPP